MKLVFLLGLCATFTLYAMDRNQSEHIFEYLIDVDSWSLCVPAPAQTSSNPAANAQPTPGMLQALHNEINNSQKQTK